MARYKQARDGEWIQPIRNGYRFMCCDCGLVHAIDFRVLKMAANRTKVQFRASRDKRATALTRRQRTRDYTIPQK